MTQRHVCFWCRTGLLSCPTLHSLITIEKSRWVIAIRHACVTYWLQRDFAFHPSNACNRICVSRCIRSCNNTNSFSRVKRALSYTVESRYRNAITDEYGRRVLFIFAIISCRRVVRLPVFIPPSLPVHRYVFVCSTRSHNSFPTTSTHFFFGLTFPRFSSTLIDFFDFTSSPSPRTRQNHIDPSSSPYNVQCTSVAPELSRIRSNESRGN